MSISNGYCTLAEFKAFKSIDSTNAGDDTVIEDIVEAASRDIDRFTGRTFYARTETRYYDTPSGTRLWLDDDLLTVTTLTNGDGDVLTASTEYLLYPYNSPPYWAVDLVDNTGLLWQLSSTTGTAQYAISLAGTWGFSASAPDDVKVACLIVARDAYLKRFGAEGESGGLVTADGVRMLPAGMPLRARDIVRPYVRMS